MHFDKSQLHFIIQKWRAATAHLQLYSFNHLKSRNSQSASQDVCPELEVNESNIVVQLKRETK